MIRVHLLENAPAKMNQNPINLFSHFWKSAIRQSALIWRCASRLSSYKAELNKD
jgi:hypothetical protein